MKIFLPLLTAVILASFFVSANACDMTADQGGTLTIPLISEQYAEIEAIDIEVAFDKNLLKLTGATLTGGILEGGDYELPPPPVTPDSDTVKLVIYSGNNLIAGSGEVAFINFDVIGKCSDTAQILLTNFKVNALPASGGFHIMDASCKNLNVSIIYDVNNDGKMGGEDAVHALQCALGAIECDDAGLAEAMCVLRAVAGIKSLYFDINNDRRMGMEEALYALRCAAGISPPDSDGIGVLHAVYILQVLSGSYNTSGAANP